ncbi:helicase [Clostridium botulinum D str. 1873]|uniref:Helicase n=1 Tax=Clostridium botulinum D str. 1873 TaxID=592027 RepID=A0A9P2G7B1_CLOBO|nr:helicase [Clostridium botulinum D str. 1873]
MKISKVLGSEKERGASSNTTADIYVINRENVVWLVKHYGKDRLFDMVVIDSFQVLNHQNPKDLRH